MSLALSASFVEVQNQVVPLAQNSGKNGLAIRVASSGSAVLGTLTATGAASTVSWTLNGNPSWVSIAIDPTTLIATLSFTNAQVQTDAYQFYVEAFDGTTTQYFPVFLEVRQPFSIAAATGATSFNVPSYDSTVGDIVFVGLGLNGAVLTGVRFIEPAVLPPGMKFITSDGGTMSLRVSESSESNVSGGISLFTASPVSMQITLAAYLPGTIYDNPDRCYVQAFTVESLTAKQGTVDLAVTVRYDTTQSAFVLNSFVDFLNGEAQAITYEWDVTGTATGNITSGGTSQSTSMTWTPATPGDVGFTVKVKNAASGVIVGESVIAPTLNSSGAGIPCSNAASWLGTDGIKLALGAAEVRGWAGDAPAFVVSTPADELADNETVTVTLGVSTGSALEGTAALSAQTVTLTQSNPTATVSLTFPASSFNEKWIVTATAANAAANATRTGYAQMVYLSNGGQPLTIACPGGYNFTSNVGEVITPLQLSATNNQMVAVPGVTYSLSGAPDGLNISPTGALTGNVLQPGTYTFQFVASANGYARSYSPTVTLTAAQFVQPLSITDAVPSVASLPDNQQFNVSWGYAGTPLTLNMIQGYTVRSVLGTTEAATTEVGSSVITIYGTSFYGDAYSIPALVLSSSITANGPLADAPTVASIDESFHLTVKWNPLTVDGKYLAYKAWNIYLKQLPNGVDQLQTINGALPTGLELTGSTPDARLYETTLSSGDWQIDMQALTSSTALAQNSLGWDLPHEFPTAITPASATFDNGTISLGQTLTLSLDPAYVGADQWQAIFPDGTTSGWMPIGVRTIAKSLSIPGNLPIVIQTLRDYSQANPAVKLLRQVTKTIFVMNQQYTGAPTSTALTGSVGFGGEAGFEITDASAASVALAPYEVIHRALVRDVLSNELKLMVATSRTANASSLLGTMALDVFPLLGRPRVADLIDPSLYLDAEMVPAGNPVKIATLALPNIVVGKPMADFPLAATVNSGVAPFSWYADNLPFGIKLSTNGTLTGTATALGSFTSDFVVMDSNVPPFIAHATLTLTVESDLAITTKALPAAVVGVAYNLPVGLAGGLPPYTWSIVAGSLPTGLSIDPATGTIVGTPVTYNSTTDFNKTYTVTVQVIDSIGAIQSTVLTMTLVPAALQFGHLDQSLLFAQGTFEIALPVFGGKAPYTLASFTDDGTIGNGLRIVNPETLATVAGVEPPTLIGTTGTQTFFPQVYGFDPAIALTASGGTAPYQFTLLPGLLTTLPGAAISSDVLTALVTADGNYSAQVQVTDALGHTATEVIAVGVQQQNAAPYAVKPVSVNLNGSNNPGNWTVTPVAALPDAKENSAYNGGSGVYYGLALYLNNVLHMTQSTANPMVFNLLEGALPTGIVANSGNSFNQSADYSGIVLFNVAGGQNPNTLGGFSFLAEFAGIIAASGALTQCVSRESITVTASGGGTTKQVVITSTNDFAVDLTFATGSPYPWVFPLAAEGGAAPYTFNLQSGSTLPGATVTQVNGLPALASASATPGTYGVLVTATDATGVVSPALAIEVEITQSPTKPVHILDSNLPTYVYANRALPTNTYYLDADQVAAWSASGLPAGVTLSTAANTRVYLGGTPTATGNFSAAITATSTIYNTAAHTTISFAVRAQAAVFANAPSTAIVGVQYRAVNNNAILQVQYTGFQPGDAMLPLLSSQNGMVGAPGVLNNGTPTTAVSNLTADGFTLSYDYTCAVYGTDVITLGNGVATLSLPVTYPQLVATGLTVPSTVSEYATAASFAAPVSVSGGLAPYTLTPTGVSDTRFSIVGGQVQANISLLTPGQTTVCSVSVLAVDASGNSVTATGVLKVTVREETYITVAFSNANWSAPVSSAAPFTLSLIPNRAQSVPQLGHPAYQYYVDAVTLPAALNGFVQASPSNRVLAIACNNSGASAQVADVDQSLNASGSFIVAAVATSDAPPAGTYSIQVALRVVDSEGLTASQTVSINLTIS